MKALIDHKLLHKILASKVHETSFLNACFDADCLTPDQQMEIIFGWPSLLEYLDLGSLFENFPLFNEQNELFTFIISILHQNSKKDLLIRAYDQVFVECLTQIKALPQIDPAFLLHHLQKKRLLNLPGQHLFTFTLNEYEKRLVENPSYTMHDLILYLAWDRACVNLAIVFEHVSPDVDIQCGLETLKECLIESFQHITAHGRTTPSFFRLLETLYAYQMREENLYLHTDSEWLILCQGTTTLQPREYLSDIYFIDATITDHPKTKKESLKTFTMASADQVKASLSLAHYMIDKLKQETLEWRYNLSSLELICLKEEKDQFIINTIVHNE